MGKREEWKYIIAGICKYYSQDSISTFLFAFLHMWTVCDEM